MTEQNTPLEVSQSITKEQIDLAYAQREEALKSLLDPAPVGVEVSHFPNFEYAKDSGLLDLFYFNPFTGEDGLRHILEGNTVVGANGAREVAGFHHEPSARREDTYVDHEYLNGRNSKAMRDYRQNPFEPYNAHVVIEGYAKSTFQQNQNGGYEQVSVKSSMFPKEYDPLAIMQAARLALETRDRRQDEPKDKRMVMTEGFAPMLDGESYMKLRFFLDKDTGQIITVFPIARGKGKPAMQLTHETTKHHLGL